MNLGDIRVFKSEHAPTHFDDGRPRLFWLVPDFEREPMTPLWPQMFDQPARAASPPKPTHWCVLVHPSRWDAFFMAINQPDVFAHPEVQELLGLVETRSSP